MLNLVERLHHKAHLFIAVTDQVREVSRNVVTEHIEMHGVQKRETLKKCSILEQMFSCFPLLVKDFKLDARSDGCWFTIPQHACRCDS